MPVASKSLDILLTEKLPKPFSTSGILLMTKRKVKTWTPGLKGLWYQNLFMYRLTVHSKILSGYPSAVILLFVSVVWFGFFCFVWGGVWLVGWFSLKTPWSSFTGIFSLMTKHLHVLPFCCRFFTLCKTVKNNSPKWPIQQTDSNSIEKH